MFPEHQINELEWFRKDDVIQRTAKKSALLLKKYIILNRKHLF